MKTGVVRLCFAISLLVTLDYTKGQINLLPNDMIVKKVAVPDEITRFLAVQSDDTLQNVVHMSALKDAGKTTERVNTTMLPLSPSAYNVSKQCMDDVVQYVSDVTKAQLYALKMADSTGKLPSGVIEGNYQWIGSSKECRKVQNVTVNGKSFNGKYCQASAYMTGIPTQLLIGVCVPDSCIGMDVLTIINTAHIIPYLTNVYVTQVKCIEERPLVTGTIVMFVIIGILTLLMVAATVYDVIITYIINRQSDSDELPITLQDGGNTDDVTSLLNSSPRTKQYTYQPGVGGECLLAFSVLTNGGKILDATHSSGTLAAIHGIRVLSMWWVILGHTFSLFNTLSDNSSAYSQEVLPRFTFQAILNAAFSVDSFFFLSGLLVTYLTLRELTEGKDVNWFMFYFHRFWRLTPLYMFIVFFNVYIFPYFIDGPYAAYVTTTENACIQHWWTNLLYINNLVPWPGKLADQCYGVSWYLANDMQFHVISPIIIILLYKIPIAGYVTMVVAMAACLASRIGISIHRDLTASFDKAFAGDKLLFISSDYYYTKPWTRISTYLVGMAVGYLLVKTKCKLRINIFINLVFWAAAWAIALAVLYGLYGTLHNHPLSTPVDVMYMTLCRVAWGVALGWLTFACLTGNGGPINAILSWKAWIPISRLTYCAYLTHIMVLQAYAMNQDRLLHLSDLNEVYMYIGTVVITYGVSFVVSLMAEAPMMRLEKVLKKTVNNLMARV